MPTPPPSEQAAKFLAALEDLWRLYPGAAPKVGAYEAYWEYLSKYPLDALLMAIRDAPRAHPQWPPTGGQLEELAKRAVKSLDKRPSTVPNERRILGKVAEPEPTGRGVEHGAFLAEKYRCEDSQAMGDATPPDVARERLKELLGLVGG